MKITDFDFSLPEDLIAQHPAEKRDESRLFVIDRHTSSFSHRRFLDIIDLLSENDVLVRNNTKVLPARLIGVKAETHAAIEVLLLRQDNDGWETLLKPARRVKVGTVIHFGEGQLKATCIDVVGDGIAKLAFEYEGVFLEVLEALGEMPLPPYIRERLSDQTRYQTVYAKEIGSAAAPTAGLHFTSELLSKLESKGVEIIDVTLHIGLGTFRPVGVDDIEAHKMHAEYYVINHKAAQSLNKAIKEKKRIVALGTTTVRTLESAYEQGFLAKSGWTDIFIYPGYKFKSIDALITNFHLPKSTLLMLVSAFSSRELMIAAYQEAIKERYRFFSFGDAMLIL